MSKISKIFHKKFSLNPKCSKMFGFKYFQFRFTQLHGQVWNVHFRGVLLWWWVHRGYLWPGFGVEMSSEKVINVKDYKLTVRSSLLLFTSVSYRQQRNSSSYLAGWSGDSRLCNWTAVITIALLRARSTIHHLSLYKAASRVPQMYECWKSEISYMTCLNYSMIHDIRLIPQQTA